MQKSCFHRPEISVSAGAVNNGMELRMQRHGVPAGRNSKIRRIGLPVHDDIAESARVLAGRREYASDALDRAQIGMVEGVVPLHRSVPRTLLQPRSKQTARLNASHRLRID